MSIDPGQPDEPSSASSALADIAQASLGLRDCVMLLARALAMLDKAALPGLIEAFEQRAKVSELTGGSRRAAPAREIAEALKTMANPAGQRPLARLTAADRAGPLN